MLFRGGGDQFLTSRFPPLDAADLNLPVVSVLAKHGRRTGGPTTAASIRDDRLVLGNLRHPCLQLVDRDVGGALDETVLFQFFGGAHVE